MRIFDVIGFALSNFLRRKARSALTVLGVIIGTAAVVIMLSIGIGMNKGFEDQISSWGDLREINVSEMYDQWNEETEQYEAVENRIPLDEQTVSELRELDNVKAVSPMIWGWGAYLIKDNREKCNSSNIQTVDAATMSEFGYEILEGRLLNESDVGTTNFVMCYNIPFNFYDPKTLKDNEWFSTVYTGKNDTELPFDPLDENIKYQFTWNYGFGEQQIDYSKPRIIPEDATCVGVLVQNSTNVENYGQDHDTYIYMDVEGYRGLNERLQKNRNKYYGIEDEDVSTTSSVMYINGVPVSDNVAEGRQSVYDQITVLVDDTKHVLDVTKEIMAMGLQTDSSMDYLQKMQEQTKFLRTVLGAIGAVAFFVAAISIANTMVMSIYERTREIGIMKVIGCKLKDIRGMFLVEAAIIGVTGGVLGVGLSYIVSTLVNKLASGGAMEMFGIYSAGAAVSIIPFWLDLVAILLATVVGVVSGLYPAIRATRLSALEAIKNE